MILHSMIKHVVIFTLIVLTGTIAAGVLFNEFNTQPVSPDLISIGIGESVYSSGSLTRVTYSGDGVLTVTNHPDSRLVNQYILNLRLDDEFQLFDKTYKVTELSHSKITLKRLG